MTFSILKNFEIRIIQFPDRGEQGGGRADERARVGF